jgi:Zn-dependent protease with chaperone function
VAALIGAIEWVSNDVPFGIHLALGFGGLALLGTAASGGVGPYRRAPGDARARAEAGLRRASPALERLCQLADLPPPALTVRDDLVPLSWTTALPQRRVYVTTGLLDRLGPRELDAVLAHELSHLANRDALVMSVVATPGLAVLRASAKPGRAGAYRSTRSCSSSPRRTCWSPCRSRGSRAWCPVSASSSRTAAPRS